MHPNQTRGKRGQWKTSDHERKARQPKRTAEQELNYVSELTVKAILEGRAFSAKVFAKELATLGYKVIGRGL